MKLNLGMFNTNNNHEQIQILRKEFRVMITKQPTRRQLIRMASTIPFFSLSALQSFAEITTIENKQIPGFFNFFVGQIKITVISDGHFTRPVSTIGTNASDEELLAFLKQYFLSTETADRYTNLVVIDNGKAKILVDVGSGSRFLPTTGKLFESLSLAGIEPEEITHVFLTHDHIWGIRDDFDEAIFPDAEYLISETEYKWWLTQDRTEKVEENFVTIVLGAQNSLLALPEITLINGTKDLSHGITAIPTIGHTPGHNSILVNSNGMSLIISGDALIDPQISFKAPHWTNDTDMDSNMTVTSRKKLLAMAVSEQSTILGYHFPFPGVGHAISHKNSYEFVPIPVYQE